MNEFDYIKENYKRICYEADNAVSKYRKSNETVNIMAVTKTVLPEAVNTAIECGINLLGENRVQEYISKKDLYDKSADICFIGHLQSNKVKYIIKDMQMIQSVDTIGLAGEINKQALKNIKRQKILLEVNIGYETSKSGIYPENLENIISAVSEMRGIEICGLMTIPPKNCGEKFFYNMQKLYIDILSKKLDNINMSVLSMGMSNDFATAIKYGSTQIRVGTALFGARK